MAVFYYLISSLPMLSVEEKPRISSKEFLASCVDFLSANQFSEIRNLRLIPPENFDNLSSQVIKEWFDWETCLRNSLAKSRGRETSIDVTHVIRGEKDFYSEINKGIQDAMGRSNPIEKEEVLDRMRWEKLCSLEVGHNFDYANLCIYRMKLLLCEKRIHWDKVKGNENFDRIVDSIYGAWTPDK
jgi:hypothetical protein